MRIGTLLIVLLAAVIAGCTIGPDYASTDLRLTRRLYAGDRVKLELMGESFNSIRGFETLQPLQSQAVTMKPISGAMRKGG